MQEQTETLNGNPFYVRRWGDPDLPNILLLHGFPENGGAWAGLAERLADRYHLIAPDQRGFGKSWAPQSVDDMRMPNLVSDMRALLQDRPAIVMGHDWGAAVAYALAAPRVGLASHLIIANGVHPILFQRALAAGSAQTAASQYITALRRAGSETYFAADDCAKLMSLFSADMDMSWLTPEKRAAYLEEWKEPGRLRAMINWYRASPLVVPPSGTSVQMPDFDETRFMVPCPHLLIWAENDTALRPETTKGLEHFAPDLTRKSIADADHWLIHQQPERVAHIMSDWLARR